MTTVEIVAQALLDARRDGVRADGSVLPSPDYHQALAIQRVVHRQIGPVSGFKVAPRPDGQPVIAPISAARTVRTGVPVRVGDRLGIELEIGFEVIAPPGPDPMAESTQVFRPRIVLELVDNRLIGAEHNALLKLADMQINDGLVVGPALAGWDGRDFGTVEARLICGGRVVVDGPATLPGGSALANLALLCAHLGDHCGGLRQGQIVITGSLSGLEYFPAGTDVSGHIADLGSVSCRLE